MNKGLIVFLSVNVLFGCVFGIETARRDKVKSTIQKPPEKKNPLNFIPKLNFQSEAVKTPEKPILPGTLPFVFRKNMGQWDSRIFFRGSLQDANVYFLKDQLSFGFIKEEEEVMEGKVEIGFKDLADLDRKKRLHLEEEHNKTYIWNIEFMGCNPNAEILTSQPQESRSNYFRGDKKFLNVPDFSEITYKDIYPYTNARYYCNGGKLEYDYHVLPSGDPSNIKLKVKGCTSISVENSKLKVDFPWGTLYDDAPFAFQYLNNLKVPVPVLYKIYNDSTYGFSLPAGYDPSRELIIDPVTILWSTFTGGTDSGNHSYLFDMVMDNNYTFYATGKFPSTLPITPGVYDNTFNGGDEDVYVLKLNSNGTVLNFATYVGGVQNEEGVSIALDGAGNIFVAGTTRPSGTGVPGNNFPVTGMAYDQTYNGESDGFLFSLNNTGNALNYSTFLGGKSYESIFDVAVNNSGEAFVTGYTCSDGGPYLLDPPFPTTSGCYDNSFNGAGGVDCFISKFDAFGANLVFSTFLGGKDTDQGFSITLNSNDEPAVCGVTGSGNINPLYVFPTTSGAYDVSYNNGYDIFVTRLNSSGSGLIYSTFIGGTSYDFPNYMIEAPSGDLYICGGTMSYDFPCSAGAYDNSFGGSYDNFICKLNPTGSALVLSTYVGGSYDDQGFGLALNNNGDIFFSGRTNSADLPVTCGAFHTSPLGGWDSFLGKLSKDGKTLYYLTYLGGNDSDYNNPVISLKGPDCDQTVFMALTTHSANYPTTAGVFQPNKLNAAGADQPAFTAYKEVPMADFSFSATPTCNVPVVFTEIQCGLWQAHDSWLWDFGDGGTSTLQNPTHTYTSSGTFTVTLTAGCHTATVSKTVVVVQGGCASVGLDLLTFKAERVHGTNSLSWSFAKEAGIKEFILEKSLDENLFTSIFKVTPDNKLSFQFEDKCDVKAWYRLNYLVNDGSRKYSDIRLIDPIHNFEIFPNPIQSGTEIHLKKLQGSVILRDLLGKEVLRLNGDQDESSFVIKIPSGIYLLESTEHEYRQKLIVY